MKSIAIGTEHLLTTYADSKDSRGHRSQGRTVYDDKSVRITLSLKNHPPIVVGHRDGLNVYTSYAGNDILPEGQHSFDVDADHEVFPGDGQRPPGIPPHTSACLTRP